MNIKTLSFGCRLNALECEKISSMMTGIMDNVILVNTCSVTAEAERQCAQTVRRLSRENPNAIIFVTGCGATRNPKLFAGISHVFVIDNKDKMNLQVYIAALKSANTDPKSSRIDVFKSNEARLSKKFIRVQNGCNHDCTYCITRLLRGPNVSYSYDEILADARAAIANGFYELVLTGVDTASYLWHDGDELVLLADICARLLRDVPEMKHLRLSSIDPASPEVPKIIELMKKDSRFMPHLHLSMQSGSDTILRSMRRRHNADKLRELVRISDGKISFSADIICGFPGETDDLFNETVNLIREIGLINVHAFPFSPRPGTVATEMPNQVNRAVSKKRVKIIYDIVAQNRAKFMQSQIGKTVSVLVEENNTGRTPDDLDIKIIGATIQNKTICDVKTTGIENDVFQGNIV